MGERLLQGRRRVVRSEVHQHRPGQRVAARCGATASSAARPDRSGARPAAGPSASAAASSASRRGLSPSGSKTKPERSITAGDLKRAAMAGRPWPQERGQGPSDLAKSEQDHAPSAPGGSPTRRRCVTAGRRRGSGAGPPRRPCRHDHGDVQLGGALRDGDDVDARRGQSARTPRPRRRACRACPGPTTATVAMPRAHLDAVDLAAARSRPGTPAAGLARRFGLRPPGTLKQIECSEDAWEISETEMLRRVQRREGAGGNAGHAQHAVAGHGDQGLAPGRGQRLDRERGRAPPARRPRCPGSRDRQRAGRRSGCAARRAESVRAGEAPSRRNRPAPPPPGRAAVG